MEQSVTTIQVYLDNGVVYSYDVTTPIRAREHADAIIKGGYRHTDNEIGTMEHFPPHRINKVKCIGGVRTNYPDTVAGT